MSTKNVVVNKLNKAELAHVLGFNFLAVKRVSKDLAERITYASKMYKEDEKKVTKRDLLDMVKEAMTTLGDKFVLATESKNVPLVVENSVKKPVAKKSAKKEEPKEEAEPEKKPVKKSAPKKKSAVETDSNGSAVKFDEEITVKDDDGESKYQIAHDIKNMEDLAEAFNDDETIVFAFFWSARQLKQYDYFNGIVEVPKSFPQDLDLATCVYVSDEGVISYAVALYTEANYFITPDCFEEVDGLRFCRGMEYQIYRLVE